MDGAEAILARYREDPQTGEMVLVRWLGGADAEVAMFEKRDGAWVELFRCPGHVGRSGIGKEKEGDWKTPVGTFELSFPFGLCEDPGSLLPYTRVHEHLWWCTDPEHYNQLIDLREHPHACTGERLTDYADYYRYAMLIGYNRECVYGRGSAIFLHCFGSSPYTAGCVSLDEAHMITVLRHARAGAKICIF